MDDENEPQEPCPDCGSEDCDSFKNDGRFKEDRFDCLERALVYWKAKANEK